ncbi:YtfJ family protein [Oceanispirochaeta sp.]|uniref:YtfJ family protein n=1 Tax=Oceanispirochaeta sp. TaxID=2035350 RepID=UPI002605B4B2|nr:YtfJ family protein [Oceanispirochaeta sp.]MDA3958914.1 hypothetical protein [Oceanispirochaeta sp.]
MKSINPLYLISLLFLLLLSQGVFALQVGDSIPGFSVVSGTGQILIRDDLNNKKVMLFYEDRSQLDLNQELKDYLKTLTLDKNSVFTAAIVDCSDLGLFKKLWEDKLVDQSRKSGLSVYGDWNGKMKERFRYEDKTSTFIVINESGEVVYFKAGVISSSEFPKISNLVQ